MKNLFVLHPDLIYKKQEKKKMLFRTKSGKNLARNELIIYVVFTILVLFLIAIII